MRSQSYSQDKLGTSRVCCDVQVITKSNRKFQQPKQFFLSSSSVIPCNTVETKHAHSNSISNLFTRIIARIIDTKALSAAIDFHMSILNYKHSSQITFSCLPHPKKRQDKMGEYTTYSLVALTAQFLLPYSYIRPENCQAHTRLSLHHFVYFNAHAPFHTRGRLGTIIYISNATKGGQT